MFRREEPQRSAPFEWLEPGSGNPFGVRVLDVRPYTQTMLSTTPNPEIASRFVELRGSNGSGLVSSSVEDFASTSCDLHLPLPAALADGSLFKAQAMEDKWDIYSFDSVLYFARSWTGQLIHRAKYRTSGDEMMITAIESAPDHSQLADQVVFFLLVSHVLGRPFPSPILDYFRGDSEKIALGSYNAFGRYALFASESDVTTLMIPEGGGSAG